MTTVNISITDNQDKLIEHFMGKYDFESRSEFFRSLLRLVSIKPQLLEESVCAPFLKPDTKNVNVVMESFKKTGKYSKAFLGELEGGIRNSKYFNEK